MELAQEIKMAAQKIKELGTAKPKEEPENSTASNIHNVGTFNIGKSIYLLSLWQNQS